MQGIDFQTQVRPDSLARERVKQTGLVSLDQLPRFAAAVESGEPLEVSLEYGQDPEGIFIQCLVKGSAHILCQFCLSDFRSPIDSNTRFRPVLTLEAAREIATDDEPVIYEGGFINIINMIEDDALLAIPNYPKCADCSNENTFSSQFATMSNSDHHQTE
jgi:uncharacterized protein